MFARLAWYIKDIYIYYITNYSRENATELRVYDQSIKEMSSEIYYMLGNKKVSSIFGFAYIDYWRKHNIPIFLVKVLAKMYRIAINIKSRINSHNNQLSIGN